MQAFVRVRLHDDVHVLAPGDIIGRTWSAALRLDDPQISEAHALVSLRGDSMKLLALRGRFALARADAPDARPDKSDKPDRDDKPLADLELAVGQRVRLARDIVLEVLEVAVPREVLALEGDGLARQVLGGVCSLRLAPRPELAPGFVADADAVFWNDGSEWTMRLHGDREQRALVPGDTFTLGARTFRAVAMPLAGGRATEAWGPLDAPLVLVVRYDTVHIHRPSIADGGRAGAMPASLALDGISARILSELATIGLPVAWQSVAHEVWPDEDELVALRRKWDTSLARLRKKLSEARIRHDLVRADGNGNFEIFLHPADKVDDQT